jgi:hypothetical protein
MRSEQSAVVNKIAIIRDANETGSLATHAVASVVVAEGAKAPTSWGPMMRV